MDTPKRKKFIFDSLPFDCWSHVVSFLDCTKDFLSLMMSVKGLSEYIGNVNPKYTKCIEFVVSRIPETKIRYATVVRIGNIDGVSNFPQFLKKKGFSKENNMFHKCVDQFPNIDTLKIFLLRRYSRRDKWIDKMRIEECYSQKLQELSLQISECNVVIRKSAVFLTLKKLVLSHLGRLSDRILRNSYEPDLMTFYSQGKMNVSWESFPQLEKLVLHSWIMLKEISPLKKNLKQLVLSNTSVLENEIKGFSKLEHLSIMSRSLMSISSISDLEELTFLELNSNMKRLDDLNDKKFDGIENAGDVKPLMGVLNFIDFPNLERLELKGIILDDQKSRIDNLPKLQTLSICGLKCFNESFSTPNNASCVEIGYLPTLTRIEFYGNNIPITLEQSEKLTNLTVVATDEVTVRNVAFNSNVNYGGGNIISLMYNFKNLKIIDFSNWNRNWKHVTPEDCTVFVARDFPLLKELYSINGHVRIGGVINCPNITTIEIHPTGEENRCTFSDLPARLSSVVLWKEKASVLVPLIQTISKQAKIIDFMEIGLTDHRGGMLRNDDKTIDCKNLFSNIKELKIEGCRYMILDGNDSAILKKFSCKLEKPMIDVSVKIRNYPFLHNIKLGIFGENNLVRRGGGGGHHRFNSVFNNVILSNLPQCKSLVLKKLTNGIHHLSIENTPISRLFIHPWIMSVSKPTGLYITGNEFPSLEEIIVNYDKEYINHVDSFYGVNKMMCISALSGLLSLKTIRIDGLIPKNGLVDLVDQIDLDKVEAVYNSRKESLRNFISKENELQENVGYGSKKIVVSRMCNE